MPPKYRVTTQTQSVIPSRENTYSMGYFGVESAYRLLAGQGSSVEKSNITAVRVVTRDNMFAIDKQKALFPFG